MIKLPELVLSDFISLDNISIIDDELSGIYFMYSDNKELLYIGQSKTLYLRIYCHIHGQTNTSDICHNFKYCRYAVVNDALDRELYETYYINTMKPPLNMAKVITYHSDRNNPKYMTMAAAKVKAQYESYIQNLAGNALNKHIKLI